MQATIELYNFVKKPVLLIGHLFLSPPLDIQSTIIQWLGGKRGAGVPGYGVRGPGVWKTRGLVENTASQRKTRGLSAKH